MNIKGKLIAKMDTVQVSDKFKKREFVVEFADNPDYPEQIKLEFIQDKCDLLDKVSIGQIVDVEFNLKGRAWTNPEGKVSYFNTLQAWKIDFESNGGNNVAKNPQPTPSTPVEFGSDTDDLPF